MVEKVRLYNLLKYVTQQLSDGKEEQQIRKRKRSHDAIFLRSRKLDMSTKVLTMVDKNRPAGNILNHEQHNTSKGCGYFAWYSDLLTQFGAFIS